MKLLPMVTVGLMLARKGRVSPEAKPSPSRRPPAPAPPRAVAPADPRLPAPIEYKPHDPLLGER